MKNFLWNSNTSKIAFNNVIQPIEEGGIKYPSPEFRIKSQKLIWLKKAFGNSNEIWIEHFRQNANYPLELLCRGSLNKCKSNNLFIKQLFDIWDDAQLFLNLPHLSNL
jgi:hypothetical protein